MDNERIDKIRNFLSNCDGNNQYHRQAVERALRFMWSRQTEDEQTVRDTRELNGIGFNAHDARFAASLIEGLDKYGKITPRQAAAASKMLRKYAKQLAAMPAA